MRKNYLLFLDDRTLFGLVLSVLTTVDIIL